MGSSRFSELRENIPLKINEFTNFESPEMSTPVGVRNAVDPKGFLIDLTEGHADAIDGHRAFFDQVGP